MKFIAYFDIVNNVLKGGSVRSPIRPKECVAIVGKDEAIGKIIADRLKIPVAKRVLDFFNDGEAHVQILDNIIGKDVFIIQSTHSPIDQRLFPVLLLADAARRSFARSITLITPYFGYSRQDRMAEPNTPISSKVVADMLYSVGINHVVTVDLHSAQTQGFFDMTIENIDTNQLFAEYIKNNIKNKKLAIVSPDAGGAKRARKIADLIGCKEVILLDKDRYAKNKSAVMNIIGNPEGKDLIIVDDIIDTAGTISNAAKSLKEHGGNKVIIIATHPVFSGNALNNLSSDNIDKIVVTNTIPIDKKLSKIEILDISDLLAKNIYNNSIS